MTAAPKNVGLSIVHENVRPFTTVALDRALSLPLHASDDYLYGFAGGGVRDFAHLLAREGIRTETTKLLFAVPHDPGRKFDSSIGFSGLQLLPPRPRAEFRDEFLALFGDVVREQYGLKELLERPAPAASKTDAFWNVVSAFPECIPAALGRTDIVVAVLPMEVQPARVFAMTLIAKTSVQGLVQSIETRGNRDLSYSMTNADGAQVAITPPVQPVPVMMINGRPGTKWRRGTHHPSNAQPSASVHERSAP